MNEALHVKPSEGPCEIHAWPDDGIMRRLLLLMRERRADRRGVNACAECLTRVVHVEKAARAAR